MLRNKLNHNCEQGIWKLIYRVERDLSTVQYWVFKTESSRHQILSNFLYYLFFIVNNIWCNLKPKLGTSYFDLIKITWARFLYPSVGAVLYSIYSLTFYSIIQWSVATKITEMYWIPTENFWQHQKLLITAIVCTVSVTFTKNNNNNLFNRQCS